MGINIEELYTSPEQKSQAETAKTLFVQVFETFISPSEGADELLKYLTKTDFFTAPASTKYHGCHPGGLVIHSVNVYERLRLLVKLEKDYNGDSKVQCITDESVARVALLHDLCKIDVYKVGTKNVKDEATNTWSKVPFYQFDDRMPYGHGEKSAYIASSYMRLTRDESMAIRWHMGAFDKAVQGGDMGMLGTAFQMHPLSLLLHQADMMATYLDEASGD